jgi:hypothetical protein
MEFVGREVALHYLVRFAVEERPELDDLRLQRAGGSWGSISGSRH